MRRVAYPLASTMLFAACIAACNALSGVEDLTPCAACELDGALPVVDAANDVTLPERDSSTGTPDAAQDGQVPADATTTLDADAEAAAPIGCQGAVDCTRVVFVTSLDYNGGLSGIAGADAKCQGLADVSSVARIKGRAFQAWVSTGATPVSLRFAHGSQPYVLGDGTVVASNWLDLIKGTLQNGIDVDEHDNTRMSSTAWTGTNSGGADYSGQACSDWTIAAPGNLGGYGNVGGSGNGWSSSSEAECINAKALYCFEK